MYLLIDNYDSFTYNLVQYIGQLNRPVEVWRNDQISVADCLAKKPKGIILSPGPCSPNEAGICLDMVKACAEHHIPLFGVCLGHQSIGQAFGANIVLAPTPIHGKISDIYHGNSSVFHGLPQAVQATRYHSLIVEKDSLPDDLEITAWTQDGLIMGIAHKNLPIHGVQFHPESIRTHAGHHLLANFLKITEDQPLEDLLPSHLSFSALSPTGSIRDKVAQKGSPA